MRSIQYFAGGGRSVFEHGVVQYYLKCTQRTRLPPFVLRHSGIMSLTLSLEPTFHSGPAWRRSPLNLSSTKACALYDAGSGLVGVEYNVLMAFGFLFVFTGV